MIKDKKKTAAMVKPQRAAKGRKPDAMARAQAEVEGCAVSEATPPSEPASQAVERVAESAVNLEPFAGVNVVADADAQVRDAFFASSSACVSAAPLVSLPTALASREMLMSDLPTRERRALAAYASDFHCSASQIEAFESEEAVSIDARRARRGTSRLIELGLLEERKAYFVTELGARVARSGGIEVTQPIALGAAPVKEAS